MIESKSNPSSSVSPVMFGGALLLFGLVIFSVPDAAVWPLSMIMIFGTLLAANRDAASRGVNGPLAELGFK